MPRLRGAAYPAGGTGPVVSPPHGKGTRPAHVVVLVAASVVVALVVLLGVLVVTADDRRGGPDGFHEPRKGEARQILDLEAPGASAPTTVPGGWATGEVFAKTTLDGVRGVGLPDGETRWTIDLGGGVCAASRGQTADHRVAVVVRAGEDHDAECTSVALLDLTTGAVVWRWKLPGGPGSYASIALGGRTVGVAWTGHSAGFDVATGKRLWHRDETWCRDRGFVGGEGLTAVVECGNPPRMKSYVKRVEPRTGEPFWEFEVPRNVRTVRIASADPLTLVVGAGEEFVSDVLTVGGDGEVESRIPLSSRYRRPCGDEVDSCYSMAVDEDRIYLATQEHNGAGPKDPPTNEVMAFERRTGRAVWKSSANGRGLLTPFARVGGGVLAYRSPGWGTGAEVLLVDPENGGRRRLLRTPAPEGDPSAEIYSTGENVPLVFADGRLFLQEATLGDDDPDHPKSTLAVGFEAPPGREGMLSSPVK